MPSDSPKIEVLFADEFKRNIHHLAKKYRHIRSDIQPVIDRLQKGEVLGDRIPESHAIFYKVRIKNSDIGKGKRSGYRLIYQVQSAKITILLTIYAKSEREDISIKRIRQIVNEWLQNQSE